MSFSKTALFSDETPSPTQVGPRGRTWNVTVKEEVASETVLRGGSQRDEGPYKLSDTRPP